MTTNSSLPDEARDDRLDVQRWYGYVYALCRARMCSSSDAEDAAQETFLRGWQNLDGLRSHQAVGAWLRQIAIFVCVDMVRRSSIRRHQPVTTSTPGSDAEADVNHVDRRDESDYVAELVEQLPELLRECIWLHYYEQKSYDEISLWLGVARSTVNERLSKARAIIRQQLQSSRPNQP